MLRRNLLTTALSLAILLASTGLAGATGLLIPADRGLQPLALRYHRVSVDVREGTATTRIEQVFVNHTNRALEASYLLPLPTDAVIIDFRLMIGGVMKKGEVLAKDKAQRIYSDIVRRMRDPGIIDWMSPNLFKARIFPVPARGEQKVEVTYTQVLPFLDGTYKVVHPLKTPAQVVRTLEDLTLTVTIAHTTPLKAIYSPTHRISVARKGDHRATVGFEGERVALDKDFILYVGVSKDEVGLSLLTHRRPGEPGYFMLMAAPKAVLNSDEVVGKAVTFVLDTSGSMAGAKMEHAKKALLWCLDQLGSDDRFDVIRFSSDVESFDDSLPAASATKLDAARDFVRGFEAAGGTAIDDALATALSRFPTDARGTTHLVIFITDGRPTVGQTHQGKILEKVAEQNGARARIFAFGIGDEVNTHLLDALASANGGTSHYVKPDEAIETHVAALYDQVAHPVLTDPKLTVGDAARAYAMLPGRLPDLFKGDQLIVIGRYRGDGDALLRFRGRLAGKDRTFDFEGTFPERQDDNAFVAQLWGHRQVGFLLDQIRLNGETPELKEEVIQLATRYGIVTPYTSYLVVEDSTRARGPLLPDSTRPPAPRPRWLRRGGGGRGAGTAPASGSFGGAGAAAAPRNFEFEGDELERSLRESAASAEPSRDLAAKSGRRSVEQAKVLKHYKDKKVAESDVSSLRYVAGRVFASRGGRWVDREYRSGMKELRIAPYSRAWMQVAAARPELKQALALGEEVVVVVGELALVVAEGGKDELSASELARLK